MKVYECAGLHLDPDHSPQKLRSHILNSHLRWPRCDKHDCELIIRERRNHRDGAVLVCPTHDRTVYTWD